MNASKTRKQIIELNDDRSILIKFLLHRGKMTAGNLYQMARVCGNPNCKCARGEKHLSWYLSTRNKGKTKLTYIGSSVPMKLEEQLKRYQQRQKSLARIRIIDKEISKLLNELRDFGTVIFNTGHSGKPKRRTKK